MDKREKILNAALKLFVERGFHATPTSAISKEAGVSAGILFHYFPTKDELIKTLFSEIKKESIEIVFANVDKINSFEGKLRLIWSNSWNWGLDNPLKFKFKQSADHSTYCEIADSDPEIQAQIEKAFGFIHEGIEQKIIKDIDPEFLGIFMFTSVATLVNYLTKYPEKRNDHSFLEQAWEMAFNAIKN